jgi:hypothetical protein
MSPRDAIAEIVAALEHAELEAACRFDHELVNSGLPR